MKKDNAIILFNQKQVRRHWDDEKELWYFSIVDVIEVLTDSPRPRKYWNALKTKLKDEGSQLSEKIGQLKMEASDGKMRIINVLDTQKVRKKSYESLMKEQVRRKSNRLETIFLKTNGSHLEPKRTEHLSSLLLSKLREKVKCK